MKAQRKKIKSLTHSMWLIKHLTRHVFSGRVAFEVAPSVPVPVLSQSVASATSFGGRLRSSLRNGKGESEGEQTQEETEILA